MMFALVDCNNFYASCERVFRPELQYQPIVILSNNDGCVVARSAEAKSLGIPMGAPAFKFSSLFDRHKVQVFSSNYALYGDMSARVMHILSGFAPEIEVYSIDEAFLKFENCPTVQFEQHGQLMRERIHKWTGIPVSIGFGPTKALSKVATRICKKFMQRTQGVYVIDSEEKRQKALKWLPVEDIWGIGRKHAARLQRLGIKRAFGFTELSEQWVKKNLSIVGLRLQQDLKGIPTLDLEDLPAKKSIATTRSFAKNYTRYDQVRERVVTFATICAQKLRKQNSVCSEVLIFVRSNRFQRQRPQYSKSVLMRLPFQTNSSIEISKVAVEGLKKIYKKGYHYKKAGVIVMNIRPEKNIQKTLFTESDPRHKPLMQVMDQINKTWGSSKVKLGSQDPGRTWIMKQEHLSRRYTTRLNEIIDVDSPKK